jgi:hypothetical protein
MTRRRTRPQPSSLLLPDTISDPSPAVAEANENYAKAIEARAKAGEEVRAIRPAVREAVHRDAPPSEIRKLEQKKEDTEHAFRAAKRAEDQAADAFATAIERDAPELVESVDFEEETEAALADLEQLAARLDAVDATVGAVVSVAQIATKGSLGSGFEPLRDQGGRYESAAAHLAALRDLIAEKRDIGRRATAQVQGQQVVAA